MSIETNYPEFTEMTMKARIVLAALLLGLAAGRSVAQPTPPRMPEPWNRKPVRQCDHARKLAQLEEDLGYINANVKDPADRNYQMQFIQNKIKILKNQMIICGCVKGTLPELPSGGSGSGGGSGRPPATVDPAKVKALLAQRTGRNLTDQQVQLYLTMKNAAFRRLTPQVEFELRKKFPQFDVTRPESFTDDAFLEVLRKSQQFYYTTLRTRLNNLNQGPVTLETTGYFIRAGQRINVPGLKVLKKRNGELVFPDAAFASPELWPLLLGEPR
jgi:hypothetical protein